METLAASQSSNPAVDDVFLSSSSSSCSSSSPRSDQAHPSASSPPPGGMSAASSSHRYVGSAHRPLVYVTRRIPQKGMDILFNGCNVKLWDAEEPVPRGELLFSVAGAHGILCMQGDVIDQEVLDAAGPSLQAVATMACAPGGHIDVSECEARGVQVLTCPDQPTETLADLTVALVLLTIKETQTEEERLVNFDLLAPDLIQNLSASPPNSSTINNTLEILTNARTQSRPRLIKQMSEERLAFQWNNGRPGNVNCPTWRNIVKKRFGIYGLTRLGLSVARLLNSLGVTDVMLVSHRESKTSESETEENTKTAGKMFKMVTLDELLENSDVVCVCDDTSSSPHSESVLVRGGRGKLQKRAEGEEMEVVPEEEEEDDVDHSGKNDNENSAQVVFDMKAFEKMNPGAILVTSRSCEPSVDYLDLYAALRDGQIRAAGLNDCNQEPVPLKAPLLGLRNCVFLPQTQESVYDMRHKVSVLIARNLTNALALTRDKSHTV